MTLQRGFTLIELVAVMVVVTILSAGAVAVLSTGGQEHLQVCREMSVSLRSLQNINMNEGSSPEFFFKIINTSSNKLFFGICRQGGYCKVLTKDDHASWVKVSSSDKVKVSVSSTNTNGAQTALVFQFDEMGRLRNATGGYAADDYKLKAQANGGSCTVLVNREGGISWQ